MFFPSSSEIIKRRFSHKQNEKNTKTDVDWSWTATRRNPRAYINSGSNPTEPKTEPIRFVIGEKLECGVLQFLSNNGKTSYLVRFNKGVREKKPFKVDGLSGKYLLVCCFDVPLPSNSQAAMQCRALIEVYDEFSRRGYPFELVVVANMRTDFVYNLEAAFYHFYSTFSCIAIPFPCFETRDYIHSSMTRSLNPLSNLAILVDPKGFILVDETPLTHFLHYGSDWAPPFLPTTLDEIEKRDELLRLRLDPMYDTVVDEVRQLPLSLYRDILLCDPRLTLSRFYRFDAAVDVFSTILDLSRKYVGLYLFIDGEIMEDIKAAHDRCLANNQQLEIVLVPLPYFDEPKSHCEQLRQALSCLNIESWFLFYTDTEARHRLWRIFAKGHDCLKEKLIIIPPDCKSGELLGRQVIINLGVDKYPFTRTAILKQRLESFRSLTLIFSSSLFNNCQMYQNGRREEFKSERFQGKNVLLYLTWSRCDHYSLMNKHYPGIKVMGWEVVLVFLDYMDRYWNKRWVVPNNVCHKCPCLNWKTVPWPIMLPSAASTSEIKDKLFFPEDRKTVYLFAVRKDGKIVSRDVQQQLNTDGVTESLFDDVLEAELASSLARIPSLDGYN